MNSCGTYIIFPLLVLILNSMSAQTTAWITSKTKGDSIVLQGMVHNNTADILSLKYTMLLETAGISGRNRSHQQSEFKAVPKSTVPLGKSVFNSKAADYYRVVLLIFENNKLITADTLQQGVEPITIASQNPEILPSVSSTSDAIEIDGLIIDETRTKPARDFYELFYNKWSAPLVAKDYSITIKELPSAGRSAQVVIAVNDIDVFQRFLQPRIDVIEMMVEQAIYYVSQYLDNNESVKQQMDQEDSKGSGIY